MAGQDGKSKDSRPSSSSGQHIPRFFLSLLDLTISLPKLVSVNDYNAGSGRRDATECGWEGT